MKHLMEFSVGSIMARTGGMGAGFTERNLPPFVHKDRYGEEAEPRYLMHLPKVCPNFNPILQLASLIGLTEDQINKEELFCGVWETTEDSLGPLSGRRGTNYTPETFCERLYRATCQAIREAEAAVKKPPLVESYKSKHFILDLTDEEGVLAAINKIQAESSDIRNRMRGAEYLASWRARLYNATTNEKTKSTYPFELPQDTEIGQRKLHDFANGVIADLNKAALNMAKTEARAFCRQVLGRKPIELSPNYGKGRGITVAKLNEIGKQIIQDALADKPKKIPGCPQMPQYDFAGMMR